MFFVIVLPLKLCGIGLVHQGLFLVFSIYMDIYFWLKTNVECKALIWPMICLRKFCFHWLFGPFGSTVIGLFSGMVQQTTIFLGCIWPRSTTIVLVLLKNRMATQTVKVSWTKPAANWFKLNTDGSSLGNPWRASGGGLVRNDRGMWIASFTRNIGKATVSRLSYGPSETVFSRAKLWIWRQQYIEIELEAKVVFDWVGGIHCSNSAHAALILD